MIGYNSIKNEKDGETAEEKEASKYRCMLQLKPGSRLVYYLGEGQLKQPLFTLRRSGDHLKATGRSRQAIFAFLLNADTST